MPIKTIIVPVDGSDPAKRATRLAAEIATRVGAAIVLVHVRRHFGSDLVPEELVALERSEHIRVSEAALLEAAAERMLGEAETLAGQQGAKQLRKVSQIGDPATQILATAKAQSGDLIVMGRRGLGPIGALLVGSVTAKVMQLAEIPCLTVP